MRPFPLSQFPLGPFPLRQFPLGTFPLGQFPPRPFPVGPTLTASAATDMGCGAVRPTSLPLLGRILTHLGGTAHSRLGRSRLANSHLGRTHPPWRLGSFPLRPRSGQCACATAARRSGFTSTTSSRPPGGGGYSRVGVLTVLTITPSRPTGSGWVLTSTGTHSTHHHPFAATR